jgi:hypothetical protein
MFAVVVIFVAATLGLPAVHTLAHPPAVHLRFDRDGGLSAAALREAVKQTRSIWSDAGVAVTAGRPGDAIPAGAAVVAVRIESEKDWQIDGHSVLGWVTMDERGQPSPIHVSMPAVDALLSRIDFLGRPFRDHTRVVRERLTSQAIGRVMAHELGHYLLRSSRHADAGLMRPHYSGTALAEYSLSSFRIGAGLRLALRQAAVAAAPAVSGG